jgi:hypothetical protein
MGRGQGEGRSSAESPLGQLVDGIGLVGAGSRLMAALGRRSPVVRRVVSLPALIAFLIPSPAPADSSAGIKSRQCQPTYEWALREAAAERALLAKHSAFIKRVGNTLELRTRNGVLKFEDVCDEGRENERVLYQFFDYFADLDHVLIQENYYEGRGYSLVGVKFGVREKIGSIPIFSPDRAHFFTVDIGDGHSANQLQIWRRHGQDWFEMAWSFRPYEYWLGASGEWLDDRTIRVTKKVRAKSQSVTYVSKSFSIRLGTDGWRIVDDPKKVK